MKIFESLDFSRDVDRYILEGEATPYELESLKLAVEVCDKNIFYWKPVSYENKYSVQVAAQKIYGNIVDDGSGVFVLVDLSRGKKPDMQTVMELKKFMQNEHLVFVSVFTQKNILLRAFARFIAGYMMDRSKFEIHADKEEAYNRLFLEIEKNKTGQNEA